MNCNNPFCKETLDPDHVTLITTVHVRRFCTMECLVMSWGFHLAKVRRGTP